MTQIRALSPHAERRLWVRYDIYPHPSHGDEIVRQVERGESRELGPANEGDENRTIHLVRICGKVVPVVYVCRDRVIATVLPAKHWRIWQLALEAGVSCRRLR